MPSYADVHTQIWSDKKFRRYSRDGKLVFLNAWTNDSANLCCIYQFDKDQAMFQMGFTDIREFDKAFQEVLDSGAIKYDPEKEIVWVVNRFKYRPKSPAVICGAISELNFLNDHSFIKEFVEKYKLWILPYIDRLHTVYRPSLNKQTNKETNNKADYISFENLKTLKKLFKDEKALKSHLLSMGFSEKDIAEALTKQVAPNKTL